MARAQRKATRKEIRDKITEILKDATDAEHRVFANRVRPLNSGSELPAILVYPKEEDYTVIDRATNTKRRDLSVIVEITAAETTEDLLSDILDKISDKVEDLLDGSDKLGDLVHDIGIDTAEGALDHKGETPEGSWIITFNVTYIRRKD